MPGPDRLEDDPAGEHEDDAPDEEPYKWADTIVEAKVREPCVNRQQHEHGDDDEGDDAEDDLNDAAKPAKPAA